jgi:hypothetical protein
MGTDHEATRCRMLDLLEQTRFETRALISSVDAERIIHTDERLWRVRDILGHLGIWNLEAARSLQAFAQGGEYFCVPSEAGYYDYNGPAAKLRQTWTMEQVWAEYEDAHEQLKQAVATLPDEKWDEELLYPWNSRGTPEYLIVVMMNHESADHGDLIRSATA